MEKISALALQIQQRSSLAEILQRAIEDVRILLKTDRVLIYRFLANQTAVVAVESVDRALPLAEDSLVGDSLAAQVINASDWQQPWTENLPASFMSQMEKWQVQSNWAAPIRNQDHVWGLLVVHHCRSAREWQPIEVQYLQQMALHLGIAVQQAELQQRTEVLQQSEARWQFVLEEAGDGFWDWNIQTNRVFCSPQWATLLGYPEQEVGDTLDEWYRRLHPDDRSTCDAKLADHVSGRTPAYQQEYRVCCRDGSEKWILDRGKVIEWTATGEPLQMIGIYTDITERKQAEERLQTLSDRFKLAIEASDVGVWDWDVVNNHLTWDDRLYELYGIQSSDFSDTYAAWETRVHPEDQAKAHAAIKQALAQETAVRHEFRVILPNGTLRYIESSALAVRNSAGQPIRLIGIDYDISDRKRAEMQQLELHQQIQILNTQLELQVQERTAQLQQSLYFEELLKRITDRVRDSLDEQEILQAVVEELAAGLQVETCDTGIYSADQTTSTIAYEFTTTPAQALGQTFAIANALHFEVYDLLFQGQVCHFCDTRSESLRPGQVVRTILACPIRDENGILGDIWLYRASQEAFNEVEIRLVQQVANQCAIALRQSRLFQATQLQVQELERLNQLKDDFLSTVSHELRTPMANIRMATQMLEISLQNLGILDATSPDASNPVQRYFKVLQTEEQREISLINDLLDLTRLDAGMEPLHLTPIEFQLYVPHLIEPFLERTRQQQQQFLVQIAPDLPPLTTDLAYLERILSELLNNACKYTPPGETIALSAQAMPEHLEICVSNSGIEIPPNERDRIFDRFYRIPSNDPWKYGGTGLGLALVKRLAQCLNCTIRVESGAGQTQFILEFKPLE